MTTDAATSDVAAGLARLLDRIYIINLESRPDRRREMQAELAELGLDADHPLVTFFPAVKPDDPGAFPSIGARGCFMSHLGVLRDAQARGCGRFLILEDDAALVPNVRRVLPRVLEELEKMPWAIAYLGHRIDPGKFPGPSANPDTEWRALPAQVGVQTTHAMAIHVRAVPALIAYLEAMLNRPAGHAEGGPMHVDGAYSWFRAGHPQALTLVTPAQYVVQRASQSDIAPPSWRDKVPFVPMLRRLKNRLT